MIDEGVPDTEAPNLLKTLCSQILVVDGPPASECGKLRERVTQAVALKEYVVNPESRTIRRWTVDAEGIPYCRACVGDILVRFTGVQAIDGFVLPGMVGVSAYSLDSMIYRTGSSQFGYWMIRRCAFITNLNVLLHDVEKTGDELIDFCIQSAFSRYRDDIVSVPV